MSNPDDLLVELMYEYKPHLQSYRHRLNTWNELLQAFNRATGANYRQSRTLKTRFEKLKELFVNGEPLQIKSMALLQRLLDECGHENRVLDDKSPSEQYQSSEHSNTPTAGFPEKSQPQQKSQLQSHSQSQRDTDFPPECEENEDQDMSRPPPLDSITIFPHTQMRRFQEERFVKNGGFAASQDFSRSSHDSPFNSQNASAADTPGEQHMVTEENIASVLESLKADFRSFNSFDYSPEDISSLAALRSEVATIKHNQEVFQRNVLAKLDRIAEVLHPTSDFLRNNSQPHQDQGYGH
ncbi:LAFA_0G19812g1_1 [Lachancea sp. 'fantastica']|nr:LAFA_0G19812g1_1 [Lachancea sp. 'fantastica']